MSASAPGQPPDAPATLRVGLILDSVRSPGWMADVIRAIQASDDAELACVLIEEAPRDPMPRPSGAWLMRLHAWADRRLFRHAGDPLDPVDLTEILAGIPRVGAHESGVATVDLRLRLGSRTAPPGPPPRFGDWAFNHGSGLPAALHPERSGLPPGLMELLTGRSCTISQLVATTATGPPRPIGHVVSGVDRLSLRRGSRRHLPKLAGLVAGALRDVRLDGELTPSEHEPVTSAGRQRPLGTTATALALGRIVVTYVGRRIIRLMAPKRWVVAVSRARPADGEVGPPDGRTFTFLQAPEGHDWADPFPISDSGRDLVFLEDYVNGRRGRLIVVELDDSAQGWRTAKSVLEHPTHLSYPFVFRWEGAWYLMPEQAGTGSLQVYRADDFPDQWQWHATVLPGVPAADATLAWIDDRWWLFAAVATKRGLPADQLHLFHSDAPLGPWVPHARNPVVSDVRTARPAGRLYQRDGRWYRPAQDGSIDYGHSISILRIERLDLDGYRERLVQTIRPAWLAGLSGIHTLNADGQVTVIDGLMRRPRVRGIARRRGGPTVTGRTGPN